MPIPGLSDALIREHTTGGSYARGQEYVENGAVQHIEESGQTITARVKGSYYIPYAVHVTYNGQGITDVECTCPYHKGSWCKHIAATLMVLLEAEGPVASPPGLPERLHALDRAQLVRLIERVAAADPDMKHRIAMELDALLQDADA